MKNINKKSLLRKSLEQLVMNGLIIGFAYTAGFYTSKYDFILNIGGSGLSLRVEPQGTYKKESQQKLQKESQDISKPKPLNILEIYRKYPYLP